MNSIPAESVGGGDSEWSELGDDIPRFDEPNVGSGKGKLKFEERSKRGLFMTPPNSSGGGISIHETSTSALEKAELQRLNVFHFYHANKYNLSCSYFYFRTTDCAKIMQD